MYKVFFFLYRGAAFQGSSNQFQALDFNQAMKKFLYLDRLHPLYELFVSSNYILFFSIYISQHHNPGHTLKKVTLYHYRFLCSKLYQNRCSVIGPDSQVLDSRPWILGLASYILGPGPRFLILDYAVLKTSYKRHIF